MEEVIRAVPKRNHSFLQEVFPKTQALHAKTEYDLTQSEQKKTMNYSSFGKGFKKVKKVWYLSKSWRDRSTALSP